VAETGKRRKGRRRMSVARHVYVLGGQSGPQKIGISADPTRRLQRVQSHSPDALLLHHQVLPEGDARLIERVAHRLLHAQRKHGEWFDVEIAEAVAAVGRAVDLVEAGDLSTLGLSSSPLIRLPALEDALRSADARADAAIALADTLAARLADAGDRSERLGRDLAEAQRAAESALRTVETLRRMDDARKARGLLARLRAAWRGE
jgi:hypothetical protein